MGVGCFNLMISLLPARIMKLLEWIGFGGNKVQSLAKKLVISVSKIRKLAVFNLFVEIQKLILYMVLKT